MNNIRQIITERLENARNEYSYLQKNSDGSDDYKLSEIIGQMEAYADVLNLVLPAPRTEADILIDFEKLGYEFAEFTICYHLKKDMGAICKTIIINKNTHSYRCVIDNCTPHLIAGEIDMQEHKLLNELFEYWGWL